MNNKHPKLYLTDEGDLYIVYPDNYVEWWSHYFESFIPSFCTSEEVVQRTDVFEFIGEVK